MMRSADCTAVSHTVHKCLPMLPLLFRLLVRAWHRRERRHRAKTMRTSCVYLWTVSLQADKSSTSCMCLSSNNMPPTPHTHNTLTHYCCLHKQLMLCLVMWWQTGQECLHLSKHTRSLECMHAQKDKKFDKQCFRSIYQIGRGIKMSNRLSWGFRLWKIADWLFSCIIFIWYTILKCTINLKSLWVASIQPSSLNCHYTAVT